MEVDLPSDAAAVVTMSTYEGKENESAAANQPQNGHSGIAAKAAAAAVETKPAVSPAPAADARKAQQTAPPSSKKKASRAAAKKQPAKKKQREAAANSGSETATDDGGDSGMDVPDLEAAPTSRTTRRSQTAKCYAELRGGSDGEDAPSDSPDDVVVVKDAPGAATEAEALLQTAGASGAKEALPKKRRLTDFVVVDETGEPVGLERSHVAPGGAWLIGVVHPAAGPMAKASGRRLEARFGPVTAWRVACSKASASVVATTEAGVAYELVKPSPTFRKTHAVVDDQAALMHQVHLALCPEAGGSMSASYDEVLAKLARAKVGKAYGGAQSLLLLSADFVLGQLAAWGDGSTAARGKGADYRNTPFGNALAAEAAKGGLGPATNAAGGITIRDAAVEPESAKQAAGAEDAVAAADAALAARLQAQWDAKDAAGAGRGGRGGGRALVAPYIRISEEEIAEDYPLPAQYIKEHDESDELLMADPEELERAAFMHADDLPRRLLTNFAFYNSEGFLSTLELVPMFTGVDHDVGLFGSGVVSEDTGDYSMDGTGEEGAAGGGQDAAGGTAGNTTAAAAPDGMRVFLSEVREWYVEWGPENALFIIVRTDVATYRLRRPSEQYAPWFKTILKAGQVATFAMGAVAEESRASKVSFADCARRLTELPPDHPAFVSKKVDRVERFLVVHGQLVLNQFKQHYAKAVQKAALLTELRTRMEQRKHLKLYVRKGKGARGAPRSRQANPMKDREPKTRAKAMPATATAMVKNVWRSYFYGVGEEEEADGAGTDTEPGAASTAPTANDAGTAKVVEDSESEEEAEGAAVETALAGGAAATAAPAGTAAKPGAKGRGNPTKVAAKPPQPKKAKAATETAHAPEAAWEGAALRTDAAGRVLYGGVKVASAAVELGDVIALHDEDEQAEEEEEAAAGTEAEVTEREAKADPAAEGNTGAMEVDCTAAALPTPARKPLPLPRGLLGLVACLFEDKKGTKMVQVRKLVRGCDTVLGDVASSDELFLMPELKVRPLADLAAKVTAAHLDRAWDRTQRLAQFQEDEARRVRNAAHLAAGEPLEYFFRAWYRPEEGMFRTIPAEMLSKAGDYVEPSLAPVELGCLPNDAGFVRKGVEYCVGDVMYLHPQAFSPAVRKDMKAAGSKPRRKPRAAKAKAGGTKAGSKAGAGASDKLPRKRRATRTAAKAKAAAAASSEEEASSAADGSSEDEDFVTGKGAEAADAPSSSGESDVGEPEAMEASEPGSDGEAEEGKGDVKEGQQEEDDEEGPKVPEYLKGKHKGSNAGLKPFALAQLVAVAKTSAGGKEPVMLRVRRLYRPEDVSRGLAYTAGWWDVYAGPLPDPTTPGADLLVDVALVVGKAAVKLRGGWGRPGRVGTKLDTFLVVGSYDPKTSPGTPGAPPATLAVPPPGSGASLPASVTSTVPRAPDEESDDEDGGEARADEEATRVPHGERGAVALSSLDIFAGCGGLSEGMHQAGVAVAKWAVEYDAAAAQAFQANYPDAAMFCNNCNVLLQAAMTKAGQRDDCDSCAECTAAVEALSPEDVARLPAPGQVEFIMGGPPCQGYSGMNRFNKRNWSLVQNSMVMGYLSWADFYRPAYFLLENVRNFVSHNKSLNFRLTLRTLLEMGYQVRFGVLNAGNYGVPQSRKRTIIWAAAPTEALPHWPQPTHVFHSPQLTVKLPGGVAYTAVPNAPGGGAPLRAVTVQDAIADLPPIENGHCTDEAAYVEPPASAFQRGIRAGATVLRDHICKEMNDLNLERCRCIPKGVPGADWRELLRIVKEDPSRELFNGQALVPWCLPNTMDRHNGWRGLFGRLDPYGHFPTSTTDPQPMGKVGQVFHPEQDRIVSVRECARSQGFPDTFRFAGNVHNRHRQVGNAVPPPLAFALGSMLRPILEEKRKAALRAAFD